MLAARPFPPLLPFLLAFALLASCGEPVYEGFEGSVDDPVEIPYYTMATPLTHAGYVGHGIGRGSSYYTFVSAVAKPTIFYNYVDPADDVDCYVYTQPDFYHGQVAANQAISETSLSVGNHDSTDYTGMRLYVKITNYDDANDLTYRIYYW